MVQIFGRFGIVAALVLAAGTSAHAEVIRPLIPAGASYGTTNSQTAITGWGGVFRPSTFISITDPVGNRQISTVTMTVVLYIGATRQVTAPQNLRCEFTLYPSFTEWQTTAFLAFPPSPQSAFLTPINTDWRDHPIQNVCGGIGWNLTFDLSNVSGFVTQAGVEMGMRAKMSYSQQDSDMSIAGLINTPAGSISDGYGIAREFGGPNVYNPLRLDAPFTFNRLAAEVTVVPAPGAAALLGLGGLIAARRRR